MKKIINYTKKSIKRIDRHSPWPLFYPWMMSKNERKAFDRISKKSNGYLEFGSGGSTIRALQKSKAKIHSVDSSLEWFEFMRKYLFVRYSEGKRLNFYHINIGKTKMWGYPINDNSKHLFPQYSSNIFEIVSTKNIDTFFIDGRFRVACVLKTILHIYTFNTNNKIILIHDFWNCEREYYHIVLNYLQVIEKIDSLGVFKLKENLDINDVEKDYEQYKYDPR